MTGCDCSSCPGCGNVDQKKMRKIIKERLMVERGMTEKEAEAELKRWEKKK
ncbi:MAG: hypothetical protein ISS36_02655 [Candidatus Aenigmarchaeota archaeon]|nr:hypothetical protein [Candidatus Aenigmarchaeota archaeon]